MPDPFEIQFIATNPKSQHVDIPELIGASLKNMSINLIISSTINII